MDFREFMQVVEADGLFINPAAEEYPGTKRVDAKDMNLHKPQTSAQGQGAFTGSGPGLANQQVRRMKKMTKK